MWVGHNHHPTGPFSSLPQSPQVEKQDDDHYKQILPPWSHGLHGAELVSS